MRAVVELLEKAVERGVFPGAQLIVVDGGRAVLETTAGRKSLGGDPVATTTLFDVASLTKPVVTSLLVLRLVEDRRLDWDAPTPLAGVTVRHLLTHSSGLPAWAPLYETAHTRDAVIAAAAGMPREREPGAASVYSDLGFIVLGDLVEKTAGRRLDALAADLIFAPTGATGARFVDLARDARPEDVAATEGVAGVVHDENCRAAGGILGHAGLFATARDIAAVAEALVDSWHGAGAFPTALTRALFTPSQVPGSTWRLGWDGPAATGSSAGELWPKSGVGHLGFTGCSLWLDPPRRRFVVLLTNRVHPTRPKSTNNEIKAFRPVLHDAIVRELGG